MAGALARRMRGGACHNPRAPMKPHLPILFEDEHLLVVDKPSGLLSVPTPGAEGRTVLDVLGELERPSFAVHRLDRDVSGALLVARDARTRDALQDLFRERALQKIYWALTLSGPNKNAGELRFPITESGGSARVSSTGKASLTRYRVLARGPLANEVEIELETGRYNQIRLHFAHARWPLVGERKYAISGDDPYKAPRVALHAWKLSFVHPRTGVRVAVEAPLPDKLADLRERVLFEPAPKPREKSAEKQTAPLRRKKRGGGRSDEAVAKRTQRGNANDARGARGGAKRRDKRR
jgi:23S rRNA pseudouridine1911/1915/1917 synthase